MNCKFYPAKFADTVAVKRYENNGYRLKRFVLTEGFGRDGVFVKTDTESSPMVFTGAIFDAVAYGDTTLTSV